MKISKLLSCSTKTPRPGGYYPILFVLRFLTDAGQDMAFFCKEDELHKFVGQKFLANPEFKCIVDKVKVPLYVRDEINAIKSWASETISFDSRGWDEI